MKIHISLKFNSDNKNSIVIIKALYVQQNKNIISKKKMYKMSKIIAITFLIGLILSKSLIKKLIQ